MGCCGLSIGNAVPSPLPPWLLYGGGGTQKVIPQVKGERPFGTGVGEEFQEEVKQWGDGKLGSRG